MKKMKKLFAILMTMAMVMGLGITGFAAEQATVTINNLDKDATVQYVQIIEPSTTAPTGWQFTGAGDAFKNSISDTADAQDVIWGLLKYKTPTLENVPSSAVKISASQLEEAFEAVTVTESATVSNGSATFNPTVAGVYAIKAFSTNDEYTYSAMGAYVKFAYGTDGSAAGVDDTKIEINAKSTNTPTTKTASTDIQAIGREVTYTVTTQVPYIKESVTSVQYKITDELTGAAYKLETAEEHEGKLKVTVTVTGEESARVYYVGVSENTFTLDLSEIAEVRTNANKTLTISYVATVTDLVVNNKVKVNEGDNELSSATEVVYSSAVTMTKNGVETDELLGGAGFKVYYVDNGTTYWATAVQKTTEEEVEIAGQYKVTGWVTSEESATQIFTATEGDDKGKVILDGLDGTTQYKFKETTAPTGYSLNKNDSPVTWTDGIDDSGKVGTASMTDTKLSALPSTGGMGTTLFTIAGCVIMISAAGLFFATRKKAN